MFFSVELLHRTKGTFGVAWLAANYPELLKKSEIRNARIDRLCDELTAIFNETVIDEQTNQPMRFSLRLNSMLMEGLVYLHKQHLKMILRDAKNLRKMYITRKLPTSGKEIDLSRKASSRAKTTNKEITSREMEMQDLEQAETALISSVSDGLLVVPSPTSPTKPPAEDLTVPAETITLKEPVSLVEEEEFHEEDMRVLSEKEVAEFLEEASDASQILGKPEGPPGTTPVSERPVPILTQESPARPPPSPPGPPETTPVSERPAPILTQESPARPPPPPPPPVISPSEEAIEPVPPKRGRKRTKIEFSDIELEEVPPSRQRVPKRRGRRGASFFDENIALSNDELRNNVLTANLELTTQMILPQKRLLSIEELFKQPSGHGIPAPLIDIFWKKLKVQSLPENQLATDIGTEESEREATAGEVSTERAREYVSMEIVREPSGLESTLPTVEETSLVSEGEKPGEEEPTLVPVEEESVEEALSAVESTSVTEPADSMLLHIPEEAPDEEIGEVPREIPVAIERQEEEVVVSPPSLEIPCVRDPSPKTPPLETPPEVTSPVPTAKDVYDMVYAKVEDCDEGEPLTFRKLVPPETTNRMTAAIAFRRLLDMHADQLFYLDQSEPYGEITIEFQ